MKQHQNLNYYWTLLIITFLVFNLHPALSFSSEPPLVNKNLSRELDPVIIKGEELPALLGRSIKHLMLYHCLDNRLEPIPFQVDERDKKGKFIMTSGQEAGRDKDKGCLDENDELVFMAHDLGDRQGKNMEKNAFHSDARIIEIEVTDPLTREKGWAYLKASPLPVQGSSLDYVVLEVKEDITCFLNKGGKTCTDYSLNYTNYLSVRFADGRLSPDVLDRIKFRLHMKLRKYLSGRTITIYEDSINITPGGYKDGPVRIIEKVKHTVKILGMTITVRETERIFYPHFTLAPSAIPIPTRMSRAFEQAVASVYLDLNSEAEGYRFFSARNPVPINIDGRMSGPELALDPVMPKWMAVTDSGHTMIQVNDLGPGLQKQAQATLYYQDSRDLADPPEDIFGQFGVGVEVDMINLKKGTYRFAAYIFGLPGAYQQGDEKKCMNLIEHPLEVAVREFNAGRPFGLVQN